jgi:hypothetical protein
MFTNVPKNQQKQGFMGSPLEEFIAALHVSRKLQSDYLAVGQYRVDLYFGDVEGNWLKQPLLNRFRYQPD